MTFPQRSSPPPACEVVNSAHDKPEDRPRAATRQFAYADNHLLFPAKAGFSVPSAGASEEGSATSVSAPAIRAATSGLPTSVATS